MNRRAYSCLGLCVLLALVACGGDDDGKPAAPDGGSAGGNAGSSGTNSNTIAGRNAAGSGGSGGGAAGRTGSGSVDEGRPCQSSNDCKADFSCVVSAIGNQGVRICARACTQDSECGNDVCESYTGQAEDQHCINLDPAPFALCGPGVTAACAARDCLFPQNSLVGVCVDICGLGPDETDAGVPEEVADRLKTCQAPQKCTPDIVSNPALGICAETVARGAECTDAGQLCEAEDTCVPDNPAEPEGKAHCFEDCSDTGKCSAGTCTTVQRVSYCKT